MNSGRHIFTAIFYSISYDFPLRDKGTGVQFQNHSVHIYNVKLPLCHLLILLYHLSTDGRKLLLGTTTVTLRHKQELR